MKNSTKLLYVALATLSLTNHVVAMESDKEVQKRRVKFVRKKSPSPVSALIASSAPDVGQVNEGLKAPKKPNQDETHTTASSTKTVSSTNTSSSKDEEKPALKKKPNPRSPQSSQRKRFDPPAELSHEELKSIFEAPFESTSPFLSHYTDDLQTRDNLRNKSHTDRKITLKTPDSEFLLMTGTGENSARVFLQGKSTFASLKETRIGRNRVGNLMSTGNFVAVLNDIETRSLSTLGEEYSSVFGVYNLYDAITEKPVTYIHEVSQQERPVKFRIAFSQEKVKKEE